MVQSSHSLTLYVGGASCGKSELAEERVCSLAPVRLYVATLMPADVWSRERVERHARRRGEGWITVEAGADLVSALEAHPEAGAVLVDGLGPWVSAHLCGLHKTAGGDGCEPASATGAAGAAEDGTAFSLSSLERAEEAFLAALSRRRRPVVVVSEETGLGLVPPDPLTRVFVERMGRLNRRVAGLADRVRFVSCGLVLELKGFSGTSGRRSR